MGTGIAQVALMAGFEVWLYDTKPQALESAQESIARRVEHAFPDTHPEITHTALTARLHVSTDFKSARNHGIQVVLEAIPEVADLKKGLFRQLEEMMAPTTVLASNTSSIPITALAKEARHPERVVGMHFMQPVPSTELVEIVRGEATNAESLELTLSLAKSLGKLPVIVKDQPGFLADRVVMPMINEAIFALGEGVADAVAIDTIMQLGFHHPLGPLAMADAIGLDTCLAILEVLHEGFNDPKYRPAPLLQRMVEKGQLGRKTRRGFYRYTRQGKRTK